MKFIDTFGPYIQYASSINKDYRVAKQVGCDFMSIEKWSKINGNKSCAEWKIHWVNHNTISPFYHLSWQREFDVIYYARVHILSVLCVWHLKKKHHRCTMYYSELWHSMLMLFHTWRLHFFFSSQFTVNCTISINVHVLK